MKVLTVAAAVIFPLVAAQIRGGTDHQQDVIGDYAPVTTSIREEVGVRHLATGGGGGGKGSTKASKMDSSESPKMPKMDASPSGKRYMMKKLECTGDKLLTNISSFPQAKRTRLIRATRWTKHRIKWIRQIKAARCLKPRSPR